MNDLPEIGFTAATFAAAMPFGVVVADGRITHAGAALQRFGIVTGDDPDEHFIVLRPHRISGFAQLPADPGRMVLLALHEFPLELKGHVVATADGTGKAFLGSAVVHSIDEFRDRDLQLADFPPSDATPDLLLAMQATNSALNDARAFSTDLQDALADVQQAMEAKARFLAVMSHEIRTPLNGFGALIDLLRERHDDPVSSRHLDTMDACARALLVLVNDVLDYSKLSAGHVALAPEPLLLRPMLHEIVEHFRAAADAAGLRLSLHVADDAPECVRGDRGRIRQVLANLINNAVKFTQDGSIDVDVRPLGDDHLVIDVRDTGPGIPPGSREKLFEPFTQVDSSATRRFGGTGLGLTICRELAHAMQGDVTLAETGPTGSCFRFELLAPECDPPREPAPEQPDAAADDRLLAGRAVLVAEDERTNQHIIEHLLRRLGCVPTIVANGALAVEAAQREVFDLVLMDLMMPELSGIDAARRIRKLGADWQRVPIVACSAAAFDTDREAAEQAGMNAFLEKPLRLNVLRDMLIAQLRDATATIG